MSELPGLGNFRRFLRNITIPAAFIIKSHADTLKQLLQPTASGGQEPVFVVFDWKDVLPQQSQVSCHHES